MILQSGGEKQIRKEIQANSITFGFKCSKWNRIKEIIHGWTGKREKLFLSFLLANNLPFIVYQIKILG